MRIAKYMAEAGIASRRKSEELILAGRVSLNGKDGADESRGWKIADLTGGLGVDSWFFSLQAS